MERFILFFILSALFAFGNVYSQTGSNSCYHIPRKEIKKLQEGDALHVYVTIDNSCSYKKPYIKVTFEGANSGPDIHIGQEAVIGKEYDFWVYSSQTTGKYDIEIFDKSPNKEPEKSKTSSESNSKENNNQGDIKKSNTSSGGSSQTNTNQNKTQNNNVSTTNNSTQKNTTQNNAQPKNNSNAANNTAADARQKELDRQQQQQQEIKRQQQEREKQKQELEQKKQQSKQNYEKTVESNKQVEQNVEKTMDDFSKNLYGSVEHKKKSENVEYTASDHSKSQNWNGENDYNKGHYTSAIEEFNMSVKNNPNNSSAFNNRGLTYIGLEKYDKAMLDFNKALQIKSNFYEAYSNRGLDYIKLKEYDKGIEDCNKAINLKSDYPFSYKYRGMAYLEQKKYSLAIKDFLKSSVLMKEYLSSLAYNPYKNDELCEINYYIGTTYSFLLKYNEAVEYLKDFIKYKHYFETTDDLNSNIKYKNRWALKIVALICRGNSNMMIGEFEDAIKDFNEVARISYLNVFLTSRGTAYRYLKNYPSRVSFSNFISIRAY